MAGVNVRDAGDTVPSVRSLEERAIVTSAVGWALRATVNVPDAPASFVTSPEVGLTVIPGGVGAAVGLRRRGPAVRSYSLWITMLPA